MSKCKELGRILPCRFRIDLTFDAKDFIADVRKKYFESGIRKEG
jgi:hypothetical protein